MTLRKALPDSERRDIWTSERELEADYKSNNIYFNKLTFKSYI